MKIAIKETEYKRGEVRIEFDVLADDGSVLRSDAIKLPMDPPDKNKTTAEQVSEMKAKFDKFARTQLQEAAKGDVLVKATLAALDGYEVAE